MYDLVEKYWPMSVGDGKATRKKKPRILAITTDCCTGCAGSPACIEYCPIEACMFWVPDEDHPPFGRIEVDPYLCIGCQKCISKGPDGAFLDGCPWDAIEMVPPTIGRRSTGLRFLMPASAAYCLSRLDPFDPAELSGSEWLLPSKPLVV